MPCTVPSCPYRPDARPVKTRTGFVCPQCREPVAIKHGSFGLDQFLLDLAQLQVLNLSKARWILLTQNCTVPTQEQRSSRIEIRRFPTPHAILGSCPESAST
jgi:hypothetical protein